MKDDPIELTRREREALHGILERKTAKEMALELGISHHAVEKRLKRARHKLGVTTSLEAARRYEAQYGETVSGPSDLGEAPASEEKGGTAGRPRSRILFAGVLIMIIATLAALFLIHPTEGTPVTDKSDVFKLLDRDGSGTIERAEFLVREANVTRIVVTDGDETSSTTVDGDAAAEMMGSAFDSMDEDGDGRLTPAEFSVDAVHRRVTLYERSGD
ncbi:LuxR C-terminal-related transcriptional regulator [Sphingomicrobium arenosum]|uniref:LuxR C-terminal-related transcriptional regulator n=1 Tax=Sphingomicrobium arenosum TaxID=2233861 RepID=UPI002240D8AC|nr:LuxR C-terminal-related transcriptional regulator [Sphingomicrobium arenosum]